VLIAFVHSVILLFGLGTAQPAAAAQSRAEKNPATANPQVLEQGRSLFRLACALCHGIDARGSRGPDLTSGRWTHGGSDAEIYRTIKAGVPGTEMPPIGGNIQDEEIWMIVAFVRSVRADADLPATGNQEAGRKIFFDRGRCSQCHMISGQGGRLGPELSRIGAARGRRYLMGSIRDPSKDIAREYESVIAVTREGKRITGVRRNEDTFSVQLMDSSEQIHLFLKRDLREVLYEKHSLMPVYGEQELDGTELQDLLAYLETLK
jgi:putative heme-binding domain-containing protein